MTFGAVSKECVIEMAKNSKDILRADISLSVSGIAGPAGATSEKPVGLVWVAISGKDDTIAYKNVFNGNREDIRLSGVRFSLNLIIDYLYSIY